MSLFRKRPATHSRLGAVAVELAIVAPMLVSIVLGLLEVGRLYDTQNLLDTAAREGARFAAMDRSGMLQEGVSANTKIIQDVTNFLSSSGVDPTSIDVDIVDAANPTLPFDLDDPLNDLKLFRLDVHVPFSSVSFTSVAPENDYSMTGSITFRNGRATLSQ